MGIISTDPNLIKLYYNSETIIGKKTLSNILSQGKQILDIDISKTNVPGSHWAEIASKLGIEIKDLIDLKHPAILGIYGEKPLSFSEHDWLAILDKNPDALAFPIAIIGENFHLVKDPSEALNFQ